MKILPVYSGNEPEIVAYRFPCPGCKGEHTLPVKSGIEGCKAVWRFTGDPNRPTFSPSILCRVGPFEDGHMEICHFFLKDGFFDFLSDCTHSLKGQKREMICYADQEFQNKSGVELSFRFHDASRKRGRIYYKNTHLANFYTDEETGMMAFNRDTLALTLDIPCAPWFETFHDLQQWITKELKEREKTVGLVHE